MHIPEVQRDSAAVINGILDSGDLGRWGLQVSRGPEGFWVFGGLQGILGTGDSENSGL